ncbi:ArsR family transcriptional regulator [Fodinisporobacter ferrooxydans]|uniref:ArsR family transcriptional regulator n=1 Tax=Fodinisporobacter ferrooxydans TaxID=2901836 RepID=A0ABY4CLD1_9BACL|nr:ArsR family transcriptional regulator [Alicyclobacillaceae bacterium MYW30-H2]
MHIGVFGADDSVAVIRSILEDYKEISYIPIIYDTEDTVVDRLRPHLDQVDMWLFSGQVPYTIAKKWGGIKVPVFYVPSTGSSLYKILLHIAHEQGLRMDQMSFDTFRPIEIERIIQEAQLDLSSPLYLKHYEGEIAADVLASYHYELWQSGKTKAAVTCLRTAHIALEQLGVPVYRVLPTRAAVEATLHLMFRTREMLRFKDSQIAVQMILVDSFFGMAKDSFSTDEIYKMEMKVTEKLLQYSKSIHGSLKMAGPGRYVIFTTRGLLREMTNDFTEKPILEDIQPLKYEDITCGIGIGNTAYQAEIHAGKALLQAKEFGKGSWFIFHENKTIVGPLGETWQIEFSTVDKNLEAIGKETSLSTATLSKLLSIAKKIGHSDITAHELAQYMQIQPRSARRILMELEKHGLVRLVAEERPHPRGRPRKVYQLNFDKKSE